MIRIIAVILLVLLGHGVPAQSPGVIAHAPAAGRAGDLRQQTFEMVWRTVKDKHFDPNFGGVDWDRVRERYQPRVDAVKSDAELYTLLQQMLMELGQSHFNIIPPEQANSPDEAEPARGGIGIDLRMIGAEAVITRVEPGSAGERAGLKAGYVIRRIDGEPVEKFFGRVDRSGNRDAFKRLMKARLLLSRIGGPPETPVVLSCLDGNDSLSEFEARREPMRGELSQPLGNFPPQYTEFVHSRMPGNLGYIRFNVFTVPVMEKVRQAIRELSDCRGLVFDLRGNPGGVGGIAAGIAGLLSASEGSLGSMKMRANQFRFAFFPQPVSFRGPVAVLIDGGSASTSEIFAGGLQELGRARIIGETSLGAALPSIFQKLPTGALFQFAIADFRTPRGVLIEGRGVVPDTEVRWDRKSLLSGRDAQLEEAVRQLQSAAQPVK